MAKRSLGARLRRAAWIALGTLVVAALAGFVVLRTSLPRTDGTVTVAGIEAPVEVLREGNGVAHVVAESDTDAYFGLGFVHAQERLWQMEMRRRLGAGRLAAVLGPAALELDRLFRTLGLARAAERAVAALDAETRAAYEAYAAGVNAYLETRSGVLPPEFLILGAPPPAPWRAADSALMLKLMAWRLSGNWRDELLRAHLAERLASEQIAALWPGYPDDGPVALSSRAPAGRLGAGLEALAARLPPGPPPGAGSNNWVVAGDRSETGMPLLANDIHLGLAAPGPFYLAHLAAPGLDVVGATLPGLPGVVLGHNGRIAWGFTNTQPDTQDLYVERLVDGDPTRYRTPDGPRRFAVRRETIAVDGADDVTITVRETRHGPVISDLGPEAADGEVLALAWTALADDDATPRAGIALQRAQDWGDFVDAARDYHGPQQNIVYADADGNIGFYAPARVPVRRAGIGWAPAPGWSGDYDWDGFVPFGELPHALNPPSGRIVTANNRIVPEGYPHFIARDWAPPYRARRITELIEGRRHTRTSFRAIQADEVSLMAREFAPHLARAEPESAPGRAAQRMMVGWDGTMAADAPEPLIFWTWYRALTRLVYADELGPLFAAAWRPRPLFMRAVLDGDQAAWCDDVASDPVETCGGLAGRALDRAASELAERYGDDLAAWGEAHAADHAHSVFRRRPPLDLVFGVRVPSGGDWYTVDAGGFPFGDSARPFAQVHGPVFRAVYDLADLERSQFVISVGQSGNPLSPHYRDFAERWRDHRPFTIPTRREAVEAARTDRLVLAPAAGGG